MTTNDPVNCNGVQTIIQQRKARRAAYHGEVTRLRSEGLAVNTIAKKLGIGASIVRSCLADLGLSPVSNAEASALRGKDSAARHAANRAKFTADAVRLLSEGYPVLRIATMLGTSRTTIATCLKEAGVERPDISTGNRMSAALASEEGRRRRTEAANATMRAVGRNRITQSQQATEQETSGAYIGIGEREIQQALRERGVDSVSQLAWNGYNIDLMAGNVAVEVHRNKGRPLFSTQALCRTLDLLGAGISVFYIWIDIRTDLISEAAIDQLVAFHDLACRNPSVLGQYRVVRGNGEIDHNSTRNFDQVTAVMARYSRLNAGSGNL